MDCGSLKELISVYVDGESSPEESRRAEEHLDLCPECARNAKLLRALGAAAVRTETQVSAGFRDRLFARMEEEGLLRRRRSLFAFSLRWAGLPLAAAAALGLFLLTSREAARGPAPPASSPSEIQRPRDASPPERGPAAPESSAGASAPVAGEALSLEERDIVANLEVLEDPQAFDEPGEIDELEIFFPNTNSRG